MVTPAFDELTQSNKVGATTPEPLVDCVVSVSVVLTVA